MDTIVQDLRKSFQEKFDTYPDKIFFSPGRVNLIGEHIDYNGGKVMPAAISHGTWLAIARNRDKMMRFQSLKFPETAQLHLQSSYGKTGKQWFNYPLGIINEMLKQGHTLSGLDMLFYGNLPVGAGLSSSASIEVVTAYAINDLFSNGMNETEIAVMSRKVENEFIGVSCGIMDQFAVAHGKENKAILLDCDSLQFEYLPVNTGKYRLVIINTNKQRTLADSKYNERFNECGQALSGLKHRLDISNLCEISPEVFEKNRGLINDPVLEKRAEHVIKENDRVKVAAMALREGRIEEFGELMYKSNESLKTLYEVSGKELDTVVEYCLGFEGVAGARMTGAGFGGCAIALVEEEKLENFKNGIVPYYTERIGYEPGVFDSQIGDGVRAVN